MPVEVTAPGLRVKVQVPVDGKAFKVTLPVAIVQFGCVIVPTEGVVGAFGTASITTFGEGDEAHPAALVTLKV